MEIKPIKSETDHKQALERVNQLWKAEPGTPEGDELEVLLTLIESYESRAFPIEPADPVEAIKFRMDQLELDAADLVPLLGQRSRVSEILNKKRKLTISMIRKLHKNLSIPLDCLVKDYALRSDRLSRSSRKAIAELESGKGKPFKDVNSLIKDMNN